MIEQKAYEKIAESASRAWLRTLTCHRAIYSGLVVCHCFGIFLTEKPMLYGPIAFLYSVLAIRG